VPLSVRPGWLWVWGILLLTLVAAGLHAVLVTQRNEQALDSFCRSIAKGEPLSAVEARAGKRGLAAKRREATGQFGPSLTITVPSGVLRGGSFCCVYHDGETVMLVFFNPWYH